MRTQTIQERTLEVYKGYEIKYHTQKFALAGYQDFYDIYKDGEQIKSFTYFNGESTAEALLEIKNWVSHEH